MKNFFFQKDQNLSQKCSNAFSTCSEVVFLVKKIDQITLEDRNLGHFEKKSKTIWISKVSKNVTKSVQTRFEVILSKFFVQCTLEGRNLEKIQNTGKTFNCSKCLKKRSQKQSNMFSTCFEVFFWQKFLPSAPWVVETRKIYKKVEKLRNFQISPKTFPKTLFDHVLLDYFDGKKLCPVNPGDSKKFHRNGKEFYFSKMSKNVSKIVQTCFDVIFSKFFGQCTLEGREVEKFQRNAKTSQNSRYPNTFPKVSKQVLNLFWGFFSKKKCPVHPGGSKLGKIRKKNRKNLNS